MTITLPDEVSVLSLDFGTLEATLLNSNKTYSLGERFRALFGLRSFRDEKAVNAIAKGWTTFPPKICDQID